MDSESLVFQIRYSLDTLWRKDLLGNVLERRAHKRNDTSCRDTINCRSTCASMRCLFGQLDIMSLSLLALFGVENQNWNIIFLLLLSFDEHSSRMQEYKEIRHENGGIQSGSLKGKRWNIYLKNNTMVAMTQHASLYSLEFEGISHSGSVYIGKSISVAKSET
ncbi:hypothetical protein CUMW_102640 [Citrus unshiu]|nr:hypothetical protein CUMW_102640 [Citrus unshiu]